MTSSETNIEQEFARYDQAQLETDALIDSLLVQYNIPEITEDAHPKAVVADQIIRLQIQRLIGSQKEGADDDSLYTMKRTIIIDALARERITADSGWIDLINDIVSTNKPVEADEVISSEIAFQKAENARSHDAFQKLATFLGKLGLFDGNHPITIEDADAFRKSLTAEQREQLEELEAQL